MSERREFDQPHGALQNDRLAGPQRANRCRGLSCIAGSFSFHRARLIAASSSPNALWWVRRPPQTLAQPAQRRLALLLSKRSIATQ